MTSEFRQQCLEISQKVSPERAIEIAYLQGKWDALKEAFGLVTDRCACNPHELKSSEATCSLDS